MKIGIITNLYPPFQRGGAEYVVIRTVEALLDAGHEVFVITGRAKKDFPISTFINSPERVYRFVPKNIYFILSDNRYWWPIRLLWHTIDAFSFFDPRYVASVLAQEKPDVVITHNLKGIGLRIPQAIKKLAIPHVHVVHDLQLIYPSGLLLAGEENVPFFIRPFYAVYRYVCRWAFAGPAVVIFPSDYLLRMYEHYDFFRNAERVCVPNPAPKFTPKIRTERLSGILRILFIGQLELHKGIRKLFEAFSGLDIDATLIVAGEGTELKFVKDKAKNDPRITYIGYVSTEQLLNCLDIADALIVPSLCYENSPTVIYEALQAGVPVLAADIGGVGELVQNGKNGFLFKPGDVRAMRVAIKQMNDQKDRFGKMQNEIRRSVENFSIDLYLQKLVLLLQSVIVKK